VSTPVRDVVRQWSDIVYIARHPAEFIEKVEEALREPEGQRVQRGLELSRKCGWENTVRTMQELIASSIKPENRPSNRKIEPLDDVEIACSYQATPGS
jgi:hypothetical protein